MAIGYGDLNHNLESNEVEGIVAEGLDSLDLASKRILVLIPDGTVTMPGAMFFPLLVKHLRRGGADEIAFMAATGTHPGLEEGRLQELIGLSALQEEGELNDISFLTHRWDDPDTFASFGEVSADLVTKISGGRLREPLVVRLNRSLLDYDHVLVCGPVFPHEVMGFSGGNDFFLPGVAGQEAIDLTHWLSALLAPSDVIGKHYTPVRALIDQAAALVPSSRHAFCLVVQDHGQVTGLYFDTPEKAWDPASRLSAKAHIIRVTRRFRRALVVIPERYQDLWTGAKGIYNVEPVVTDGGEVVLFAPHINEISSVHGEQIRRIGYHVMDYFLRQWGKFSGVPRGIVAHLTHLQGGGSYQDGVEEPRIRITLATGIPAEVCETVNLGYMDPQSVDLESWGGREDEGVLLVRNAGERLYRLKRG